MAALWSFLQKAFVDACLVDFAQADVADAVRQLRMNILEDLYQISDGERLIYGSPEVGAYESRW